MIVISKIITIGRATPKDTRETLNCSESKILSTNVPKPPPMGRLLVLVHVAINPRYTKGLCPYQQMRLLNLYKLSGAH
ncbi:hypothetical protein RN49_17560 [Pantoea agglomerans]|nr:hypothetical protein RN49_17560 [Pantoea agglomerans]MBA5704821.1 hypothetical protein [Pantoea agglomerans]